MNYGDSTRTVKAVDSEAVVGQPVSHYPVLDDSLLCECHVLAASFIFFFLEYYGDPRDMHLSFRRPRSRCIIDRAFDPLP